MDEDPIRAALEEWTRGLAPLAARIALFNRVRDLAYRYPSSRNPLEVLRDGAGSCSGKHYLLGELYRRLGVPVRHMQCTYRFNDSPLPFPDHMQELLQKNEIVDVHDYLQIGVDGDWVDVDATWPLALRDFGLPVTDDWDGRSSMNLTVVSDEHEQVSGDLAKAKEERLSRLTPRQRMLRKQFLEALGQWVLELQAEAPR
ncbi:MAG: transglutaminase domain-containing protein [Candidatus Binatia bacterium]